MRKVLREIEQLDTAAKEQGGLRSVANRLQQQRRLHMQRMLFGLESVSTDV
ncbi:hypothetical protein OGR47_05960 [Methylocystis sp. MJC1]|jgi:hypothetical protein|uniref:hypothetical protein n=1 Tax=Methylocystis sp. MJC1 TaxID=2654282 RepID=UPI0013EB2C4B|nr:hypothetical protein [Methylocystis sp. MJC1]MBU6526545.1 hypothetical protein [Methylocystis sp. MJC1]UZX12989.1 hypothetical protein OGR47_05960 [Methylocystis sp. MJC1]